MPATTATTTTEENIDIDQETTNHRQQQQRNNLMQIDQVFEELLAKMEVLSVQNHYQGQYGVIGSSKVKDWTSPLTPPPPPPPPFASSVNGRAQQQQQQQQQQLPPHHHQMCANATSSKPLDQNNSEELIIVGDESGQHEPDIDVVDGRLPAPNSPQQQQQHFYHQNQHAHQQFYQQQKQQEQQQEYHQHPNQQKQEQQYQQQQQHFNHGLMDAATMAATVNAASGGKHGYAATTYNNNLFYCDPSPADDVTSPTMAEVHFGVAATSDTDEIDELMVNELSLMLQAKLREAKSRHLACTEVSLPWDLTPRIAVEIIKISEREPCGVRGCSIFIEFEDEPNNTRRIASFKVDPDTVSTFELYLTLKHDRSGWISLIPQFLRNLTRSSTILISPDFTLTKNKLYSCE